LALGSKKSRGDSRPRLSCGAKARQNWSPLTSGPWFTKSGTELLLGPSVIPPAFTLESIHGGTVALQSAAKVADKAIDWQEIQGNGAPV